MTKQNTRELQLKSVINDIMWMAIRYAHGRNTYAPSTVREAVQIMKSLYPDWELGKDDTIKPPKKEEIKGMNFREDYLDDLFKIKTL